jgi:hypothetical protein
MSDRFTKRANSLVYDTHNIITKSTLASDVEKEKDDINPVNIAMENVNKMLRKQIEEYIFGMNKPFAMRNVFYNKEIV